MKRTVIEYKEYGEWIYIQKIKNVATETDLAYYLVKKGCTKESLDEYLRGYTTMFDCSEDASYVYDMWEDCILIRYLHYCTTSWRLIRAHTLITREDFEKVIRDLQKGGERLEKIVAKWQKETKEVKI
jgi:hypothetical protein